MARTTLNFQQVVRTGIVPTFTAVDAVNGNQFANDGRMGLHVKNAGASPTNATFLTPQVIDGDLAVPDRVVTIAAGAEKKIGPFPPSGPEGYNQADGNVYVDWSVGTSVTVNVFRV